MTDGPITRQEWNFLVRTVEVGFAGINARLDRANGRLNEAEQEIAVLKDRSDDAIRNRWVDRGVGILLAALLTAKEFAKEFFR